MAERLRAELQQAQAAIEDMSERVAELARANEELAVKLKEEAHLRALAEKQLRDLRERAPPDSGPRRAGDVTLHRELSVALQELQVMQEELRAARGSFDSASTVNRHS